MSMNHCIFTGNLTADPELKVIAAKNGGEYQVVKFSIGLNNNGQAAVFPRFEAWGETAERINKYFKKGKLIRLYAQYAEDKWQNDEGESRSRSFFKVDRFEFPESNARPVGEDEEQEQGERPSKTKAKTSTPKTETKKTRGRPKKDETPAIEVDDDESEIFF